MDKTAPTVSGAPDRQADANGWYNRPLTISFSGSDGISGIATCSSGLRRPRHVCSVRLGHVPRQSGKRRGRHRRVQVRRDGSDDHFAANETGEAIHGHHVEGVGRREAGGAHTLARRQGCGTERGLSRVVDQASGRRSHPGRKYRYTIAVYDEAANRSTREVDFVGRGALLNPAPAERVSSAPLLVWTPVKRATYYNVVLVRGRRVFSAWPTQPRLQLPRTWIFRGKRHRLGPGLYRWYVWPGFGRLSAGRFGGLLGGSTFVVAP